MSDTPLAKTQNASEPETLKQLLARPEMTKAIADVLPSNWRAEMMLRLFNIAISRQPKLNHCTRNSVLQALMQAAQLGIDPSGVLGLGYLVPFKDTCTFIIGAKGLIDLARRGGKVSAIESRVVYAHDEFALDYAASPPIKRHVPKLGGDRGEPILFYATAWLVGSDRPQVEIMTVDEVNRIRDASPAFKWDKSSPWHQHYTEMGRKTVVRRLCKSLPMSIEAAAAMSQQLSYEQENEDRLGVVAPPQPSLGAAALAERLRPEPPIAQPLDIGDAQPIGHNLDVSA